MIQIRHRYCAMLVVALAGCTTATEPDSSARQLEEASSEAAVPLTQFAQLPGIIDLDDKRRRKWDSPIIADLDGNGFMDMILTEHANRAIIYWNEGGIFSGPDTLVGGDSHGLTAGDVDGDGLVEVIVSMGGGAGANPRNPRAFKIGTDRTITALGEYTDFERSRGRAAKLFDPNKDGALDLVLSAFPLESQPDGANLLYQNRPGIDFSKAQRLPQAKWLGYKTMVTDFNRDGSADILFYGGANMVALKGAPDLGFTDVSDAVFTAAKNISHVSSVSALDYDRDGDTDYFLTRAEHQFEMENYHDPANQRFAFFVRFKPFSLDNIKVEGDLVLENLQLAFPDFNIYVGANKTPITLAGERHPGHNLTITREEAGGWPEDPSGHGIFIGYLGDQTWRIAGHARSATAGVIHNVLSAPAATKDETLPTVLLENRGGVFVDVTADMGISINEQTTNAVTGDFNNDGWQDLFVIRYGNPAMPNEQILLINQNGAGFSRDTNHGLISEELGATGGGAEAFDYDLDGDLDLIYSNERGLWHLFTNQNNPTDQARGAIVDIKTSPGAGVSPIGAQVELTACGISQHRIVAETSSPFSQGANTQLHFGLGDCTEQPLVDVIWPNGESEVELMWSMKGSVSYASTY